MQNIIKTKRKKQDLRWIWDKDKNNNDHNTKRIKIMTKNSIWNRQSQRIIIKSYEKDHYI